MRREAPVDAMTDRLDRRPRPQTNRIRQIGLLSPLLGVHFDKAQFLPSTCLVRLLLTLIPAVAALASRSLPCTILPHAALPQSPDVIEMPRMERMTTYPPYSLQQPVQPQIQLTRNHDCPPVPFARHPVERLDGHAVAFIVHVDGFYICPRAY
jgi:hypothetical protein